MRNFAFLALTAGLLAGPVAASAATIQAPTFFDIKKGGANQDVSGQFLGFDPKLGTLTGVSISVSGNLTWTTGEEGGHDPMATLLLVLSPIPASQTIKAPADGNDVDVKVDLNGAAAASLIGPGVQTETLFISDDSDGELARTVLDGTVTYTYTPSSAPVPEPSTWAMMLLGFAGLGYAAVRRKGALRRGAA
jgi:PEP-CTERM motif